MSSKKNRYTTSLPSVWVTSSTSTSGERTPSRKGPDSTSITTPITDTEDHDTTLPPESSKTPAVTEQPPKPVSLAKSRYTSSIPSGWNSSPSTVLAAARPGAPSLPHSAIQVGPHSHAGGAALGTGQGQAAANVAIHGSSMTPPPAPTSLYFPGVEHGMRYGKLHFAGATFGSVKSISPGNERDLPPMAPTMSPAMTQGLSTTYSPSEGCDLPAKAPTHSPAYSVT